MAGSSPVLDRVMLFAAGPLIYLLFAAAGIVSLLAMRKQDRTTNLWMAGQVGAALLLGFLVNRVLRMMAFHERPFQTRPVTQLVQHEPGVSFPSNHATAAITVALVVGIFVSALWGWLLALPALLVAFSRVFVGVHWPSDIIMGGIVGIVATLVVWWAGKLLLRKYSPAEQDEEDDLAELTAVLPRVPAAEETVVLPKIRR
ncbi:phosphatase PAP2 family protein [Allokutzneria sp. NRRL B-24872]|uniref:phosphatase PAP2 family protein n=1 Tax=Allokutzneria sp. NRRL B-24872 TaxID=1137961 RepID=UPI00143DB67C|nr:phosphatase PAP2 family protein [Allokutzneria sp. NRRL B-24872]